VYSNINAGGRGAQTEKKHANKWSQQDRFNILQHQHWWERSLKRKKSEMSARKENPTCELSPPNQSTYGSHDGPESN